ncbi:EpsI family protein [Rhodocyclus tenuis]|uniref:EpsI family protein n=2 Tax=Rhodocyclus TaxID=1064 RepID=A0A6L5JUY9_RHOTE|nr:exosortase-associated protein EpsI, B-type [Rhodocyclus gracilis]MQY51029.1 EpsI family protein [Rhodocyclus gracilis]MRD73008.1 EpsI family protein [Rhodocyclus gracilis]NJA88739.1 EpsI family protein [Rhodocyclus gracilis]
MNVWLRNLILLVLMLATSGIAVALRPSQKIADQGPKVDLETMIPRAFDNWHEDTQAPAVIADPQQKELLEKIYNQTLSRTYVNTDGYRIMLAIAYGSEQSSTMKVHKPEICYPAQGFTLERKSSGTLALAGGSIPATRILATLGQRSEPVTYWTTIGDHVVRSRFNRKLVEIGYGLTGKIPDGLLVRISSIDHDTDKAYEIQNGFAAQMLNALSPASQQRLIGSLESN